MEKHKRKTVAQSVTAKKWMKAYWDKVNEKKSGGVAIPQASVSCHPPDGQGQGEQFTNAEYQDKL